MNSKYFFTVFTTAYNRVSTLYRVYESLSAQTLRDFEWLVADNGSSDNVREVVSQWAKEASFPIRLIYWDKNVGYHGAVNRGVKEALGEFFLRIDSDDRCAPQALEVFRQHGDSIPDNEKSQFSGVSALSEDQHGNLVGEKFPSDILDSDSLEVKYKFKIKGERWGFHKTSILRQYPFSEEHGDLPPSIIWSQISRRYKTRFINQILRTWYINEPGRTDQLTYHYKMDKRAKGLALKHLDVLNNDMKWFWAAPLEFLRSGIHYARFSLHSREGIAGQIRRLNNGVAVFLWMLTLPIGMFLFIKEGW